MLIGMSLVHNDKSKGWLEKWIKRGIECFDKWVICDDFSSDDTYEYIKKLNNDKIILIRTNKETFKENENLIRSILWNKVKEIANENDWVMCLDSDEIPCEEFEKSMKIMIKNKGVIAFKKLEMWNENEYRIDGLWSNYFVRAFPFEDKDWTNKEAGFHNSQLPAYTKNYTTLINSDIRIMHLAYQTPELRKTKYDFMMSNPQQKQDVTYYHLQSVFDQNPKLKSVDASMPKTLLTIFFYNLYELPVQTKHFLETTKIPNQDIVIYATKCSAKLLQELENLNCKQCIDYKVINSMPDKEASEFKLKNNFFIDYSNKLLDYDIVLMANGHKPLNEQLVYHHIICEKDCMLDVSDYNFIGIMRDILAKYLDAKGYLYIKNTEPIFIQIARVISLMRYYIWGTVSMVPFPINNAIK